MRVIATCIVALGLFASSATAGTTATGDKGTTPAASDAAVTTAQPESSPAPATTPANAAAPANAEASGMESELQQLRDLLEAQSRQLKAQQEQMQLLEEKLNGSSSSSASPAAESASAAPAAIGPTVIATPSAPAKAAPAQDAPTPNSINIKGISLTPGGFMAAETVWRQKAIGSDINTSFNANIFPGNSQAHMSEFNASGRQSRISMLVEGKLADVKIGGYYETDFLSAGVTSNNNQSNSYTLRQRQFWGQAAFNSGWTFTGGQQWSLLTETTSGLNNRSEALPQVIDAQYMVGFSWARQYGMRVTKNLYNNKVFLGFAVEEAQATLTAHGNPTATSGGSVVCTNDPCTTTATINPTTFNNFLLGEFGTSGGLYNTLGNYAFNPAPDLVFKAAFEPGFGHYEVFGVLSQFRDRVFPCVVNSATLPACGTGAAAPASGADAFNSSRTGGGLGANARWSVMQKKVDVGIHFFGGDGIGRYGSAGLSDATVRPNGTLALIHNYQALGTLQFHPTPKLDINLYAGGEYEARSAYVKATGLASVTSTGNEGYGGLGLSNSGCWTETLPISAPSTSSNTGVPTGVGGSNGFIPGALGSCTADTRNIIEGSISFWYRFYKGSKGTVQWGAQYANYVRNTWRGVAGSGEAASGQPHSDQNMVFTSFRYVLP